MQDIGDGVSVIVPMYNAATKDVLHLTYPIAAHYDAFTAHQCDFWYDAPPSEGLF